MGEIGESLGKDALMVGYGTGCVLKRKWDTSPLKTASRGTESSPLAAAATTRRKPWPTAALSIRREVAFGRSSRNSFVVWFVAMYRMQLWVVKEGVP